MSTSSLPIREFCKLLAAKQPTPGGGSAAALVGAVGSAAASMSAAYTMRKKDIESGAANKAEALVSSLDLEMMLKTIDDDIDAYKNLQRTWKEDMKPEEKEAIEAFALAVPSRLVESCHSYVVQIDSFLPSCNPNITSDAKVGIHLLAGSARSAYQTVLVNKPSDEEKSRLKALLQEIGSIEGKLLNE